MEEEKGVELEWSTEFLFSEHSIYTNGDPSLIILNYILPRKDFLDRLWKKAKVKLCVDGGTNRLYNHFNNNPEDREKYIPDYICGDLDSIEPEIMNYYISRGAQKKFLYNQDYTDFQKSLSFLKSLDEENYVKNDVYVLGSLNGRFDHTISNVSTLYKVPKEKHVYLIANESVVILLNKGKHKIYCFPKYEGPTCGLLPIGITEAYVSTKGLKWNLDGSFPLSFKTMISSSNAFEHPEQEINEVIINTEQPLYWSVECNLNEK
ncbi:Thiamin pyrophosphokinase [Anaeromyces robustus]|uniref:Thiamine pyrophosphokinase n=1 Tax=Anaeromyces robustus TaxID=1754192 RepID=A0A1Y1VUL4_9FUNG|nr:Thiamin pyrophosphokinase [Anaeromyces robustus]|eukprot:ORX64706.1 Thiamin pyrophosphokinase [Anaeromyces robustus]